MTTLLMSSRDVHGVALLGVEGHAPGARPFRKSVEVLLELHVVLVAGDFSVEQGVVSEESDARPGVHLGRNIINENDEQERT